MSDLLARANRIFGGEPIAKQLEHRKAIVFVRGAPVGIDETAAQRAVDKLQDAEVPTPEELQALERCIRLMRPVWVVRNGKCEVEERWTPLIRGVAALARAKESESLATGFLVSARMLVTNIHVVHALAGNKLRSGMAVARFGLEAEALGEEVDVLQLIACHESEDVAILEIDPPQSGVPLPVARQPRAATGAPVVVVGYPQRDGHDTLFVDAVFDGLYGVQRVSPGELTGTFEKLLFHDCSTLGGNSGSPVIDRDQGVVVGVHSSGTFAYRNQAVDTSVLFSDAHLRQCVENWV